VTVNQHDLPLEPGRARRVVWVVLDGATHWITRRLMAEGRLPFLSTLAGRGAFAAARPEGPNLETPTQLATLFTGTLPREHGIHGFYLPRLTDPFARESGFTPARLRTEPIWRRVLAAGRTVALAHVAFTDPARVEGQSERCVFLADGYNPPGPEVLVKPRAMRERLAAEVGPFVGNGALAAYLDGRLGASHLTGAGAEDLPGPGPAERALLASLEACANHFQRTAEFVLDCFPADLTLLYYPCPDELAHAVQVYVEANAESTDPRRFAAAWAMTREVYGRADRYLASIHDRLGDDEALVVSSDHGVAGVHTTVHVNAVLARRGLAAFRPDGRLDPGATRVFLPPANHGFLLQHQGEMRDLDRAVRALLDLRDPATGESVFDCVLHPCSAFESDVGARFLKAMPGYELSAACADRPLAPSVMKGHHQSGADRDELQGIFLAHGPGVAGHDPEAHSWPPVVDNVLVAGLVERMLGMGKA
jgi:type I phosphodiesterase/nucleotide pyrophosphatase